MKRKAMVAAAVSITAVLMGGCSSGGSAITSEIAQANPWEEVESLEAAQEAVGFEISVPDMSDYGSDEVYRVCAALVEIEIQYNDGEDQGAYIRKAQDDGDISGDYEEHAYEEEVAVGENTVTLKGESADDVHLAVWNVGNYAYCISLTDGVSSDVMSELAAGVE